MAINDPIRELFPGINAPDGTGAPGSDPGSSGTDSVSATVTDPTGSPWNRFTTQTHGTIQPGQNDDGLIGVSTHDITNTGAGDGSASHFPRFPWQQAAK